MSASKLFNPINYLKGVGPERAKALEDELGIRTWGDLLVYYPFRYNDRSQIVAIKDVVSDAVHVQVQGTLTDIKEVGAARAKRLTARLQDKTGSIELVWFKGVRWLARSLKEKQEYIAYGRPQQYKGHFNLPHPELELVEQARITAGSSLKPVYGTTEKLTAKGLHSAGIEKLTRTLVEEGVFREVEENIPEYLLIQFRLMNRGDALAQVHMPQDQALLELARRRLKFEELLFIQLQLVRKKNLTTRNERGAVFEKVGHYFNTFYSEHLPFELTGAQKRVLREIRSDVARGHHMNRLLQGDVGSGKTIVSLLAALIAIDNGYQAALMAPTEILAQQHYATLAPMLESLGLRASLLTGSSKSAARRLLLADLAAGKIHLLIGTHALIEPSVEFARLGMCIIDEQHRFGVAQRARLWSKAELPPHILVMTATPIPRTLAMTLYGDLDVSVIDELPPGRKPIHTRHLTDGHRLEVFGFMENEIAKGRQIYVVYPLIEESEKLDLKDLTDGYESIVRRFPLPQYRVSIVHGRMDSAARNYEMEQFVSGKTHILVATTVIEVGVNVPNASVMVIESAERFGLSQLHQLRGRVGRGADQSYCILVSGKKLNPTSYRRIDTMCSTGDGFRIAEVDLELRGPGDLMGTQQSGILTLKMADLARDQQILAAARQCALDLLDDDADLTMPKNAPLRNYLLSMEEMKTDWSKIS